MERGTGPPRLLYSRVAEQRLIRRLQPAGLGKERILTIPMPKQQDIWRLDRQGVPHAEIARRLHVDRSTVARYARMEDCTPKPPVDRRYGSKIDPYAHLVDGWLESDRLMPRKQRHTARRIHDRLLSETDYDGEYSTTQRYVRRWRQANQAPSDGYCELEWAPGTAQVDFGVARARIAGEWVEDHCLVVTFPHSNMRYVASMPGENAECLCHGLLLVFGHVGGVPPVLVLDNATGAGHRDAKGHVTLTKVFDAFLSRHRIEARFCNPYSGSEKGSVENAVGFLRRNLMVPPLEAESHGQLTRVMLERCDGLARARRHHRSADTSIMERFAADRDALMPLPSTRFDPIRWEIRKADKYGRIDIDSNRYLAGGGWHGRRLLAAVRWDSVRIADPESGETVAEYPRRYGKTAGTLRDPALVMPMLAARPGSWRETPIRPDFPEDVREWLDRADGRRLRDSLRVIAQATLAAGFDNAMLAASDSIGLRPEAGPAETDLVSLALRHRDGEPDGTDAQGPDLLDYDRCINGDGPDDGEEGR